MNHVSKAACSKTDTMALLNLVFFKVLSFSLKHQIFKAYIEDWEWPCKNPVSKRRLRTKYEGLHWLDKNGLLQVGKLEKLDWQGGRDGMAVVFDCGVKDGNGGVVLV
jgi:hypothetical protein